MRSVACLAVLLLAPLFDVVAQAPPPLEPGQRVRVTAPQLGLNKQAATFETVENDTLIAVVEGDIAVADRTIRLPLASVERVDVHGGRQNHPWRGAGIGFLSGAVIGGVLGVAAASGEGEHLCTSTKAACGAFGAAVLGTFTGLVGLSIGALIKTDKWVEVPLDNFRVSIVPQREGFGAGGSFSF